MPDNLSFSFADTSQHQPLAARMRPACIDEYVGQPHLLGEGKPLRRALELGQVHSMILWGPPGTGKTTLAELFASHCNAEIERISAVTAGVKDIRAAIERAQSNATDLGRRTLLFVDEVHRFNKSQQDAFLPHIEAGTVTFIGATTENPSFELNAALLSRARVYVIKPLDEASLRLLLNQAMSDAERGLASQQLTLAEEAEELLIALASGDARRLLNLLEMASDLVDGDDRLITKQLVADVSGSQVAQFDKQGDHYYDQISALHKSIRGSSADGALYWYARMLNAGCDPLYIARRLLAIASEDVGNADPKAMEVALNAWDCFQRVGPAEGERAIAQAIVYLAVAPKSNAVYTAFKQALRDAAELPQYEVPVHLRNAPTKLAKSMGHGAEYRYAHDEPGAYAAGESYLPPELNGRHYYQPTDRGLEKKIQQKLAYLAELDATSNKKR
ncbi:MULTISPECIES: replication-associated recombination protein A [Corallincola]|uniref:Replication-associated recombination protein A n=2 Tax=Corallincola TaxID=1775176 RepID=A0ABY1WUM4_9GAMM|nr:MULTISPECIES: replication-associated recombination protein A [Corallincola]TAA48377.1 replication-associated recombination protein A [Corallincola spongiicola]TCI01356.1 replication-associated recombination protein A [Corallincola luteus]